MRLRDWIDRAFEVGERRSERVNRIARRLGISHSAVYGYIRGEYRPSLPNAVEISRETNGEVRPEDLIDDEENVRTC